MLFPNDGVIEVENKKHRLYNLCFFVAQNDPKIAKTL